MRVGRVSRLLLLYTFVSSLLLKVDDLLSKHNLNFVNYKYFAKSSLSNYPINQLANYPFDLTAPSAGSSNRSSEIVTVNTSSNEDLTARLAPKVIS